jgi:hypothetical protein
MQHDLLHTRPFQVDLERACRNGRPARPISVLRTVLRTIWETLPEAFAARRRYEHMLSRGVPQQTALREALGIASDCDRTPRVASSPTGLPRQRA